MKLTMREMELYALGFNDAGFEKHREAMFYIHQLAQLFRMDVGKRGEKWPKLSSFLPRRPGEGKKETRAEKGKRIRDMIMSLARPGEVTANGKPLKVKKKKKA